MPSAFNGFLHCFYAQKKVSVTKGRICLSAHASFISASPITALKVECRQETELQWAKVGCALNVYVSESLGQESL